MTDVLSQYGLRAKDPNNSRMLIRQDGGCCRVMCMECVTQFDVAGEIKPADAIGESSVVQRCLEHLRSCTLKGRPAETAVYQNKISPHLFQLTVRWAA